MESRNVHIGLCIEGFNPFRSFVAPYSSWSVILTVYNLPLGICVRSVFMVLSIITPGSNSLGINIDVCLHPLIDELKQCGHLGLDI